MSALKDLKVVDFGRVGAGPRATKDLGDNGAIVIKVESRTNVDQNRLSAPFKDGIIDPDRSLHFVPSNSSKYSVTLNLKHPKGIEIAKRLVKWSDVVLENFGYGVMDRMGLGYDELRKIKNDIIMVSVSITGRTGPYKTYKGYGNSGAALSGHAALTGWPDRPPVMPVFTFADVTTPLFAIIAIMSALEYKRQTGRGQYIDVSQLETMVQFISPAYLDYFANGTIQNRIGNRCAWAVPHGAFPCSGNDNWCTIAIFKDREWSNFCRVTGISELLVDPKFTTFNDRKRNEDELEGIISKWTLSYTKQEAVSILQGAGIEAAVVQDVSDLIVDTHLKERGHIVSLEHPFIGYCDHQTPPFKLSDTPAVVHRVPCLGEHNNFVYTKLLGMSDIEFVDLLNEGVFE